MLDLLAKLKAGVSNVLIIDWPGQSDVKIGIRCLNENDYLDASIACDALFKNSKIGMENIDAYDAEKNNQLLYRAIINPDTKKSLTSNMVEFRTLLTKDVRDQLIAEVNKFQQECSPSLTNTNSDELDILLAEVKKNAEKTVSSVSNIFLLRKLAVTLAAELQTLQKGNGSSL